MPIVLPVVLIVTPSESAASSIPEWRFAASPCNSIVLVSLSTEGLLVCAAAMAGAGS